MLQTGLKPNNVQHIMAIYNLLLNAYIRENKQP